MKDSDKKVVRKLKQIAVISLIFMAIEIVGGALAHSIAIMADAFHLFSDVIAYGISLYAVLLASKKSPKYLSFGFEKAQPLGALINVAIIWIVTIELFIEATNRIISQEVVREPLFMLLTSIFGLGCNLVIMKILHSGQGHGHSHQHAHGHSHGHSHNHSDHHDHGHKCNNHHDHESKQKQEHQYQQFIPSLCSCDAPNPNQILKQNQKRKTKTSQKDIQAPLELEVDLMSKSKYRGYCVIHQNTQSEHQNEHGHGHGHGHHHFFQNINIQAAYIHILSDLILSIGVIVSAIIIYIFGENQWTPWQLADPFCTYLFSIVALYSTISIMRQSVLLLMDGMEDPDLVEKSQYFIKILKEKHPRLDLKKYRLWSTNRGKHYFAIRGHLKKQSLPKNDQPQHLFKNYTQSEVIHNQIHAFCQQKKIECYIDIHG